MRRSRGSTLVELLAIVSIIALLMAILMTAPGRVCVQSRTLARRAPLRQHRLAMGMYFDESSSRFPDVSMEFKSASHSCVREGAG